MRPRRPKQYCLQLVIYIYLHSYLSLFFWLSKRMFTQTYPSDTQSHCVKTSTSFGNYSKFFFPYLTMIHVNTPTSFPSPPKYQDPVVQRADKAFQQIYSYQQDNCFSNVMPNCEQRFIQQIVLSNPVLHVTTISVAMAN